MGPPNSLNLLKLHRMLNSGLPGTPPFQQHLHSHDPLTHHSSPSTPLGVPSGLPLCTGASGSGTSLHPVPLQNSLSEEIANMKKLQDELLLNKGREEPGG